MRTTKPKPRPIDQIEREFDATLAKAFDLARELLAHPITAAHEKKKLKRNSPKERTLCGNTTN